MQKGKADEELNIIVSRVLLVGISLVISLMSISFFLSLLRPVSLPTSTISLADFPSALSQGRPEAFLNLSLVILLITPSLCVTVLLVEFVRRRQWLFAIIALTVLAVLALSATLGVRG
ncbi:MAG TPA: DUF1634 domain-containing protein [Chloroflexi bacterium]|nr:DUF1634 domain-containing protein [Chloroflexota bacterium]